MIEATLSDLRKSHGFQDSNEVIQIIDGRKRHQVGYFIPKSLAKDFEGYLSNIENMKHSALLKRLANAQKQDPVGDGCIDDGGINKRFFINEAE